MMGELPKIRILNHETGLQSYLLGKFLLNFKEMTQIGLWQFLISVKPFAQLFFHIAQLDP